MSKNNLPFPYLWFFIFAVALFSCQDAKQTTEETVLAPPKLVCQPLSTSDEIDSPQAEVYLEIAEYKIKLAEMLNCEPIEKENFAALQIPTEALSAAGGWWAGAGDYFYAIEEGENILIKQGEMHEEKLANTYDYRTIATFSKTGKPKYSSSEVVGLYALEEGDSSYLLFVGMKESAFDALYLQFEGKLPERVQLPYLLRFTQPYQFQNFLVEMEELSFDSDFGQGSFQKMGAEMHITFFEKHSPSKQNLRLQKIR